MCALLLVLSGVVAPAAIVCQVPVVISGRIEDAATRQPILGVSVLSGDSSVATITDSAGNFDLQLPTSGPWIVRARSGSDTCLSASTSAGRRNRDATYSSWSPLRSRSKH
jgi:hypothetical protein